MSKVLLGTGVFMWDSPERCTQRYGYFFPSCDTNDGTVKVTPTFNKIEAFALNGKKVKISVKVAENRKSGHVGDLFINITPSTPEVGEEVVLGVGDLDIQSNPYQNGVYDLGLKPFPKRSTYWIDPNKLYRLHDQTVEIYAELTDEPYSLAPEIKPVKEVGAISTGDGMLQLMGINPTEENW